MNEAAIRIIAIDAQNQHNLRDGNDFADYLSLYPRDARELNRCFFDLLNFVRGERISNGWLFDLIFEFERLDPNFKGRWDVSAGTEKCDLSPNDCQPFCQLEPAKLGIYNDNARHRDSLQGGC